MTQARSAKLCWTGRVLSAQPRIHLNRSFDLRSHSYLGYALRFEGDMDGQAAVFSVGIGPSAQAKYEFRVGDEVEGLAVAVADPRTEAVEFYKASGLRIVARGEESAQSNPPWHGVPPALPTYRTRGHRRLDPRTYKSRCTTCIWGCRMAVEMIIDQWEPNVKRYRYETFCYGPKSCLLCAAGATWKVPGRRSMTWEEEDWVDEEATVHRGDDE